MRDLHDFLSEREIYILENHPDKSYAKLASELDITAIQITKGGVPFDGLELETFRGRGHPLAVVLPILQKPKKLF